MLKALHKEYFGLCNTHGMSVSHQIGYCDYYITTNSPYEFEVKWPPAEQPVVQSIVTSKQETIKKDENIERVLLCGTQWL